MDSVQQILKKKNLSKIDIIGCGPTGKHWEDADSSYSIGVNDCWKWGRHTDELVILNTRDSFTPMRLAIIEDSNPDILVTNFPGMFKIQAKAVQGVYDFQSYFLNSQLDGKTLYRAHSSTFMAVSLAFNRGAKDIVMWGVDFSNHNTITGAILFDEMKKWRQLYFALTKKNCNLWVGKETRLLSQFIPTYENRNNNTDTLRQTGTA